MKRPMRWIHLIMVVALLMSWNLPLLAASPTSTKITSVDVQQKNNSISIVIKAGSPIEYKTTMIEDPRRSLVIDIPSAILWMKQTTIPVKHTASGAVVEQVRVGQFSSSPDIVRVVVDLSNDVKHEEKLTDTGRLLTVAVNADKSTDSAVINTTEKTAPKTTAYNKELKEAHKLSAQSVTTPVLKANTYAPVKPYAVKQAVMVTPKTTKTDSYATVDKLIAAANAKKPVSVKKASAKKAEPKKMEEGNDSTPSNPLVSISVDNGDLVGIIKGFGRDSNSNIIIDNAVKGTVTIKLVNVPLEQALSLILTSQGFGFRRLSGNVLVVAPVDKLEKYESARVASGPVKTQVIPLENAKAGDLLSTIKLSVPDVKIEVDSRLNALVVKAPLDTIKEVKSLVSQLDVPSVAPTTIPQSTEVIQLNYAQAKEIPNLMKGLIPANAMIVDDRLNSLIVTGTPGVVDTIRNFLNAVDIPLPQVMLEMNVVSVTEGGQKTLGMLQPALVDFKFNEKGRDKTLTSVAAEPSPFTITEFLRPGFHTFTRTAISLTNTLNILVKNTEAKILANPKIATMNNQDATILVGERIPLVYYDPRAGLYQAQYIDTGIKLDVKPTISPDGYVIMKLSPQVSEPGEFIQNFPRISTRSATTMVRVKSGETVVIGGLIRENSSKAVTKFPLLGDIPILGELFKNRTKTNDKTDLIITVTPRILAQSGSK